MFASDEKARLEHDDLLRQHFNRWATSGVGDEMEAWHRVVTEKAIQHMRLSPQERILDVGCGNGWTCRALARLSPESAIVGIDLSGEMIHRAREKSTGQPNILFAPGSAEEIPWAGDYFSLILSVESACYWYSPDQALREMFRVAAWGGQLVLLMFFCLENPHAHHWQEHVGTPMQLKSAAQWKELFERWGFEKVESRQIADDRPVEDAFTPDVHWRSREEKQAFRRAGALMVSGRKPPPPEPGPITSAPDPFRILP